MCCDECGMSLVICGQSDGSKGHISYHCSRSLLVRAQQPPITVDCQMEASLGFHEALGTAVV